MKRFLMGFAVLVCLACTFAACSSGVGGDGSGGGTSAGIGGDGGGGGTSPAFVGSVSGIGGDGSGGGTIPLNIDTGAAKSFRKATELKSSAIQCDSIDIYGLTTGKKLASGVCDEKGNYSLKIPLEELKGKLSDETGSSFIFRGVFRATKGDKIYYGFIQSTISTSSDSIAVDPINPESTLAVLQMLEKLKISDITNSGQITNADFTIITSNAFNPDCFFKLQKDLFETADIDGAGAAAAKLLNACNAYAAFETTLPAGYTNWGDFILDCTQGKDEALSILSGKQSTYFGATIADLTSYAKILDAFNQVIGNTFSGASCESKLADATFIDTLIARDPSCIAEPDYWDSCLPITFTDKSFSVSSSDGCSVSDNNTTFSQSNSTYTSDSITGSQHKVKFNYDNSSNCSSAKFCNGSTQCMYGQWSDCSSCEISQSKGVITGVVHGCTVNQTSCTFTLTQE